MEVHVDVRLIVLTILYAVIKAQDDSSKVDVTDKLLYHCKWCLRNLSSAACKLLDNGTISCVRCKEHLIDGLVCSTCSTGLESNLTLPQVECDTCLCNKSFDAGKFNECNHVKERCFVCHLNNTDLQCTHCTNGNSDGVLQGKCATESDQVETKKKSEFSTKEKIIVAVCSAFGAAFLATTVFLIYRHCKSRSFSVKKPFWTVELTNCNYDDLDFSLLAPITDIPFVYRNDVGEFDGEALLGTEKPQLVTEVDVGTEVS